MTTTINPLAQPDHDASSTSAAHPAWTSYQRVAFRIAFLYWGWFCLQALTVLIFLLPDSLSKVLGKVADLPTDAYQWVGVHLFHLAGEAATVHETGAGDTALGWVTLLCELSLALFIALIWSAISEYRGKRREYRTLYAWLRLLMRFILGAIVLFYSFGKIFPAQFPAPGLARLSEPIGQASPMGLLWTFMGASNAYRIFAGLAELIPAVLLFFRRTSTLGALMAAAVMFNVVMLNFAFDVPVKIYSTQLLLMALFLLLPDVMPLWRFLISRRESVLTGVWVAPIERKPLRIAAHVLQGFVVVSFLVGGTLIGYSNSQSRLQHPPLYGAWAVDSAIGTPADQHWEKLFAERTNLLQVSATSGVQQSINVKYLPATQTLNLTPKDSAPVSLHWTTPDPTHLNLTGTWDGKATAIAMHRIDVAPFPLQTRGFHWVQEYPFNH